MDDLQFICSDLRCSDRALPWEDADDIVDDWPWTATTEEFWSWCWRWFIATRCAMDCGSADVCWLLLTTLDVVTGTSIGSQRGVTVASVSLNSPVEDISDVVITSRISSLIARRSTSMSLVYNSNTHQMATVCVCQRHLRLHLKAALLHQALVQLVQVYGLQWHSSSSNHQTPI